MLRSIIDQDNGRQRAQSGSLRHATTECVTRGNLTTNSNALAAMWQIWCETFKQAAYAGEIWWNSL